MTTNELDLTADILDVRGIIERVEELEDERDNYTATNRDGYQTMIGANWHDDNQEDAEELKTLTAIMDELKGNGGDEQWRGDWYPVTLIRESHFTDYAQELVCDCYDLKGLPAFVHIDWEATAREVLMDYSEITIDGITYFYR